MPGCSEIIDVGENRPDLPSTDFLGNPRIISNLIGPVVDIGAVESILSDLEDLILHIPEEFVLYQNYPNPFNPTTTIEFVLPKSSELTLKIFNILGEEVATLLSASLLSGSHSVRWDASHIASGIYLYRLETGDFLETRKMVLMK